MKGLIWLVIIIIVIVGIILLTGNNETPTLDNNLTVPTGTTTPPPTTPPVTSVKEFTVSASPFMFDMKEIRVQKGDTVKITLMNTEGTHDWRVEGYEVGTKVIQGGESDMIEFIADTSGTFEYYCSVGNRRQMG